MEFVYYVASTVRSFRSKHFGKAFFQLTSQVILIKVLFFIKKISFDGRVLAEDK